jgi:hypothetical protein
VNLTGHALRLELDRPIKLDKTRHRWLAALRQRLDLLTHPLLGVARWECGSGKSGKVRAKLSHLAPAVLNGVQQALLALAQRRLDLDGLKCGATGATVPQPCLAGRQRPRGCLPRRRPRCLHLCEPIEVSGRLVERSLRRDDLRSIQRQMEPAILAMIGETPQCPIGLNPGHTRGPDIFELRDNRMEVLSSETQCSEPVSSRWRQEFQDVELRPDMRA